MTFDPMHTNQPHLPMNAMWPLVLGLLFLSTREAASAWNQQFGGPQSTSHVVSTAPYTSSWSMSFETFINSEQFLQTYNPAVSEDGVIFLPLQPTVSVVAVSPTGKKLWQASLASECTVVTNVLYSTTQDSVFVACGTTIAANQSFTHLYAINASSGETVWSQYILDSDPAKLLSLSEREQLLFFFGESELSKGVKLQNFTHSCVLYLRLDTGALVWEDKQTYCDTQWDGYTQTKVGSVNTSDHLLTPLFNQDNVVLLPTQSPGRATWSVRTPKYEYYEHMYLGFAISGETGALFSSASLMPWSTGGFPNHYYMFALHGSDGSVIFNTTGHCSNSSALVSSPILDSNGAVYYSCGQEIVSLYAINGNLRWRSKKVTQDYNRLGNPPLPPSLHITKGLLYFVSAVGLISVVSMEDGGRVNDIKIPTTSTVVHPPILVGDAFMYLLTRSAGDGDVNLTVSLMQL